MGYENNSEVLGTAVEVLAEEVHRIAKNHGWWDEERNEAEVLCLIHSEVSEALEALRISPKKITEEERLLQVGEELADVMIRVMDYTAFKGIPIGFHIIEKMKINRDRPYKHGKKF